MLLCKYLESDPSGVEDAASAPTFQHNTGMTKLDILNLKFHHHGHISGNSDSQPFVLHPVLQEFQGIIESDPNIYMAFHQMFEQIPRIYDLDPSGRPQIRDYQQMLRAINSIFTEAPGDLGDGVKGILVPVPLSAIFNWPMCTDAGLYAFTNNKVNALMKKILRTWAQFLSSPESRHGLTKDANGWFGPTASKLIPNFIETYECDPEKEYYGYTCWDDFFTRRFRQGVRPLLHPDNPNIIIGACESVTYKIATQIQKFDSFWLKGEPYSLSHMLNHDPLSTQFIGGTVYQAFLSAYSYHRCHSPVDGTIVKVAHVPGTYLSLSPTTSFNETGGTPDPKAPIRSQAYVTHVATRLLLFIEADNSEIGLMCVVMVGMVEVSSCEATVRVGDRVKKGDQLGMFHFGGSTHCMIFRPDTTLKFMDVVYRSLEDQETVVLLHDAVAVVESRNPC